MSEKTSRITHLKRQLAVLTEQLIALENAPDLGELPDGTVITFKRNDSHEGVLTYAATKVEDVWWTTSSRATMKKIVSTTLVEWIGADVTTIRVLGRWDGDRQDFMHATPPFDPDYLEH